MYRSKARRRVQIPVTRSTTAMQPVLRHLDQLHEYGVRFAPPLQPPETQ